MVKELQVREAPQEVPWEEQTQMFYEFSVEGIPLPEKMEQLLEDRFALSLGDRDPSAVRAEKEWDLFYMWLSTWPDPEAATPGERLAAYSKEIKHLGWIK